VNAASAGDLPLETWEDQSQAALVRRWGVPALLLLQSTTSTNDVAREWAAQGAAPWSVVLAEEQTAGRGRNHKPWLSTPGASISLSVVVPGLGPDDALPLRVGLAVAEALEEVAPPLHPSLKWPNDVLLEGRKVAGILCETAGASVVVGVGVNMGHRSRDFPAPLAEVATSVALSLSDGAEMPSRATVVGAILSRLREQWSRGPAGWRKGWDARDALRGHSVTCTQGPAGEAVGFDARGALLVRTPSNPVVPVVSGSVEVVEDPRVSLSRD